MKRSRALSFSIFYFSVCWRTHDPQLPISSTKGSWDEMVTLTFHFPLVVCEPLAQYLFNTKHMLYPSRYWLEVRWRGKKRACSLNCPRPWRCHLATDVNLMVPFATHSKPLDYHHPTTLYFCLFIGHLVVCSLSLPPPPPPLPPREILIKSGVRWEGRSSAHIYEEWQCSCALSRERGLTYVFLLWYKFCNFTSAV